MEAPLRVKGIGTVLSYGNVTDDEQGGASGSDLPELFKISLLRKAEACGSKDDPVFESEAPIDHGAENCVVHDAVPPYQAPKGPYSLINQDID